MYVTCIIIDDEHLARKRIATLLKAFESVRLLGECSNGEEAIDAIGRLSPDFVFIDIKMKDMTGFEVLAAIDQDKKPMPIIVSAYDTYAMQAFDTYVFDFLLKPIEKERFKKCVENVVSQILSNNQNYIQRMNKALANLETTLKEVERNTNQKIPVKIGNKIIFIDLKDIVFFLASGSYSELYLKDKKLVVRDSLSNIHKSLDSNFLRIHRSTIINKEYITEIQQSSYYEIDIKMMGVRSFRVSKSYRKNVLEQLKIK